MIQLEIMEADVNDSGVYELVAKNAEGETQSQTVELTAAQVEMSLKAQEEAAESKAKKKKKKKKKVEKKDIIAPEISSFLRNYILKEGEKIDIKCRLEEEIEEGDGCLFDRYVLELVCGITVGSVQSFRALLTFVRSEFNN